MLEEREEKYTFFRRLSDAPKIIRENERERNKSQAKRAEAAEKLLEKERELERERKESELEPAKKYARVIEDLETTLAVDENIRQLASKIKNSREPEKILELNVGEAIATYTIKIGEPFKGTLQERAQPDNPRDTTMFAYTPNVRMQNQINLQFSCINDEQIVFSPKYKVYVPIEDWEASYYNYKSRDLFVLSSYYRRRTAFFPQKDSADKSQRIFVEELYKLYKYIIEVLEHDRSDSPKTDREIIREFYKKKDDTASLE